MIDEVVTGVKFGETVIVVIFDVLNPKLSIAVNENT